jgi:hypothetical protein
MTGPMESVDNKTEEIKDIGIFYPERACHEKSIKGIAENNLYDPGGFAYQWSNRV